MAASSLWMLAVEVDVRARDLPADVAVKLVAEQGFSAIRFDKHLYQ
jgi:hypothetical protein